MTAARAHVVDRPREAVRVAVAAMIALAACRGRGPIAATVPSDGTAKLPAEASNVLRADYAGSQACADCHAQIYATWDASPMRNMTRDAATAKIRAPFDGAELRVGAEVARMTTENGQRIVTHVTPTETTHYRVTKVVGGRYREDFVGLDLDHPGDTTEHVLPATYVFSTQSWRYKGYSVMVKERPAMSARGAWSQECVPCHNVMPFATMLYDELYGPKLPAYQGKLSDRILPASKTWPVRALDDDKLARYVASEIELIGGARPVAQDLHGLLAEAAVISNDKLTGKHLVELGVGCEACHNGAKAHAADPSRVPTFAVASDAVAVVPPPHQQGTRAQLINHQCAKCHTVLFSHYPYTWEGGTRMKNPGGSTTNSGEGRDFQLGGCASAMACTTCHDPHTVDTKDKYERLATPAGNATCTGCHPALASDAAVAKHSHHQVGGAGTSCIACHMPKKNMGLDYGLVRYHRIGSPDDTARVTGDRPLECALCHADKSIESIVTTMEGWWGKHYDREKLHRLYGADLSRNALRAALDGLPHEQAVAIATLGAAKDATAIDAIVPHLAHAYPLVRFYAQRALQAITGKPVAIDLNQSAAAIRPQAAAWRAALGAP